MKGYLAKFSDGFEARISRSRKLYSHAWTATGTRGGAQMRLKGFAATLDLANKAGRGEAGRTRGFTLEHFEVVPVVVLESTP